ncbi:MAG TPA: PQQ-binding-like beta-propeller repeat protein [Candidatus Sulfotelmatobacter sp.]|nr:PQQ-binding-like beta-propeller repeat protein [Candidatus Sulfotelmatobacter sp.]
MKRTSPKFSSTLLVVLTSAAIAAAATALLMAGPFPRRVKADGVSGEAVYREYCGSCHDHAGPRIPPRSALQALSAARILRTLDAGVMMRIAYGLQRNQREAVANYLGKANDDTAPPATAFCSDRKFSLSDGSRSSWTGWSPSPSNDRFQPAGLAALTVEQVRNLKLKWAFGFAGDITAYAAPTIQNGVLFVGSAGGVVHAMNAKTGCLYWTFQADGPVRAATAIAPNESGHAILFADQIGSFYALDAADGRLLWKRRIDSHEATRLTGSAAVHDGVVFVPAASWEETRSGNPKYPCCTFRGSLSALRVRDGSVLWKTYTIDPPKKTGVNKEGAPRFGPSGAGIWSAPTVDTKRGVIYVATGDNYTEPTTKTSDAVMALDLKTGKIIWTQQVTAGDFHSGGACPDDDSKCGPDHDFGSSAILVHPGGHDLLVAGQKSGVVYALDPDARGKILWQARVGKGGLLGGVQWGMTSDGDNVYAAVSDAVGVDDPEGGESPPIGGGSFDPVAGGGLTALRLTDGSKSWFAPSYPCAPPRPGCSPAQSGALSAIPGAVFSGSLDGHIRAFSTDDGKLLWDFDTERDFATVNGIAAHGGSLDGAGPVIVDGVVYVNSGYPRFGGAIGNVLLAFTADDGNTQ